MRKIFTQMCFFSKQPILVILLAFCGFNAQGQVYSVTLPQQCNNSTGGTETMTFPATPVNAVSNATLSIHYAGDLDFPSSNEFLNFNGEGGTLLGSTVAITQCSGSSTFTYSIPMATVSSWAATGNNIVITANAGSGVNSLSGCVNGQTNAFCVTGTLTYSYSTIPEDISPQALISPILPPNCYTTTETIVVEIENQGVDTIDFSVDTGYVTATIGGPNPQVITQAITTGTLIPQNTMNVTFTTPYDMSAAGTYTFDITTSMAADTNFTNDTLSTISITSNPFAGTISANTTSICSGNSATITLSGNTGNFVWQNNTSGTWVTTTNTNNPLVVSPSSNTQYRALICGATTTQPITISVLTPSPPTTTPGSRCGFGPVTMSANGTGTLAWYNNSTGGAILDTGNTYTPTLGSTTTFYVENQVPGGAGTAGLVNNSSTAGGATANKGLEFTVNNTAVIDSVAVYAIATSGTHAQVNISIEDAITGAELFQTGLDSVQALGGKGWVKLGVTVTPGMYRMILKGINNSSTLYLDPNPGTFPYNASTGDLSITNGWSGSGFSSDYNYFYDWRIHSLCTSTRTSVTANVTPAAPINFTISDTTPCYGDTITLATSSPNPGYTYTYSPTATLLTTTGSSVQAVPTSNVTYIVSALDGNNCTAYDTISVSTTTIPPSVPTSTASEICSGQSTQFSVSNADNTLYTYTWTPSTGLNNANIHNPTASPTTGSTPTVIPYQLTTTHPPSGCTQTHNMTLTINPSTSINLGPDDTVCQYSSVIIDAGSNYNTYHWNNGEIGQVRVLNNIPYTQTVTVTVSNQYGCTASDTKKYVVVPSPLINLGPNHNVCMNVSVPLTAPSNFASYLWHNGDTTQSIVAGPYYTPGVYMQSVTVTNSFGCSNSDTVMVTVLNCVGVDEFTNETQVTIYPNPNDGNFFIAIDSPIEDNATLEIINLQGQVIHGQPIRISSGFKQELNMTDVPPGLYFVRVSGPEFNTVKRVVIR